MPEINSASVIFFGIAMTGAVILLVALIWLAVDIYKFFKKHPR